MRLTNLFNTLILVILIGNSTPAQQLNVSFTEENTDKVETTASAKKRQLNFFIVSARKKGKLDLGSRFDILRGKIKSFFRRKKFVAIVARSSQQVSESIKYRLQRFNANIGTLWFDSHGTYKKGYAVFRIGKDEFNYKSIKDSSYRISLQELAIYTNENSKVVIGSCYGGATYLRKSLHSDDTLRMNGDSLMIGLGKIFNRSTIYACESWVMTKPGLFLKRAAVAGHPTQKLYKDIVYRPAWENMSKWNEYNAATESFNAVNPVTMDNDGNLMVRSDEVTDKDKMKKEIEKKLKKLRPGLLKIK